MYRGCISDNTKQRMLCDEETPNKEGICKKCSESGCNDMPRSKSPSISCVHCDKSLECAYGQNETNLIACKGDIKFGTEESCYTHYGKTILFLQIYFSL